MLIQNANTGDWQSMQSTVWMARPPAELEVVIDFAPESDLSVIACYCASQGSTPEVWKVPAKCRLAMFLHQHLIGIFCLYFSFFFFFW